MATTNSSRIGKSLALRAATNSATQDFSAAGHCGVELHESQIGATDRQQFIDDALDLLKEALVLLDAAMAHQPAALIDLAINVLVGWSPDGIDMTDVAREPHLRSRHT